jgi:rubrerythrin
MNEISCKHCGSSDCRGCNIYRLEQMLNAGKLDTLMNENHAIQISADVRPVAHGEWEFEYENLDEQTEYCCSVCDWIGVNANEYNYCPNCGADMREVQDG